jgi:beta-glucosidase
MEKFIFGCATAAYQIEGAYNINKEESIWDRFTKIEGNILDGSDASIACNSYHRYKEDINLLKNLGVSAYRFSISWCRIVNKNGEKIKEGIEYYTNLAKLLKENGIEPFVTLYHWDMPGYIQDKGGFLNDEISNDFANYTDIITKALKPYVKYFITINEPQCIMFLGHRLGLHAPGLKLNDKDMLHAIHNLLLCHGHAVRIIRRNILNSTVGFAPCSRPQIPSCNNKELYDLCKEKYFSLNRYKEYANSVAIYSDPIFLGDYPKEYYLEFKDVLPNITKEDLEIISTPIDYISKYLYRKLLYLRES